MGIGTALFFFSLDAFAGSSTLRGCHEIHICNTCMHMTLCQFGFDIFPSIPLLKPLKRWLIHSPLHFLLPPTSFIVFVLLCCEIN